MRRAAAIHTLAIAFALGGCVELPDFPRPSIVDGPRVLALIADPPEANPGEPVTLSLFVVEAESYEVTWRACGAFDSFVGGGSQYGEEDDDGCGGGNAFELGDQRTALLPGALTQGLFDNLELAAVILGAELPPDTIRDIREKVGLPFLIEANVIADGKPIRVLKRVLISERPEPHSNPPPPSFALGDIAIVPDPEQPLRCMTADGRVARARAGVELEIAPATEDNEETWLEEYQVIDARGQLQQRKERAFYSWFSSGGEFEQEVTKSPLRNELWRTPKQAGDYPLWVVVRDGHGGTSACQLDVEITSPDTE